MALQSAKALLDELMGRGRDLGPSQQKIDMDWNDSRVLIFNLLLCLHYDIISFFRFANIF